MLLLKQLKIILKHYDCIINNCDYDIVRVDDEARIKIHTEE